MLNFFSTLAILDNNVVVVCVYVRNVVDLGNLSDLWMMFDDRGAIKVISVAIYNFIGKHGCRMIAFQIIHRVKGNTFVAFSNCDFFLLLFVIYRRKKEKLIILRSSIIFETFMNVSELMKVKFIQVKNMNYIYILSIIEIIESFNE